MRATARKQPRGNHVDGQTARLQTPGNDEVTLTKVTEAEELRRQRDRFAAERSKIAAEYESTLTGILAQSTRARLSRLAQSTLHQSDASIFSPKHDEGEIMQAPPSLPTEATLQEVWQSVNEFDGINEKDKQASSDGFTASIVTPRGDELDDATEKCLEYNHRTVLLARQRHMRSRL